MKTYLSVDLDFWNYYGKNQFNKSFFYKILTSDIPKLLVDEHHKLLPHINNFNFDEVINLDYHSDMADNLHIFDDNHRAKKLFATPPRLNCGVWGNHVKNRKNSTFIWKHPHKDKVLWRGGCHTECYIPLSSQTWDGPVIKNNNPFGEYGSLVTGWKKTKMLYSNPKKVTNILKRDIIGIGISLSEDYTYNYLLHNFAMWFNKHKDDFKNLEIRECAHKVLNRAIVEY